jgi:hypothetical protein
VGRIIVVGGPNMGRQLFDMSRSTGQAPMTTDRYLAQPGGKGASALSYSGPGLMLPERDTVDRAVTKISGSATEISP